MEKFFPTETELYRRGFRYPTGIDEAGRGPLAGPVVAAACVFPEGKKIEGIKDSKQLTPARRKELFWQILSQSLVGVGIVSEQEIDRINILQASLLAMRRAVFSLPITPDALLIDGPFKINWPLTQFPIIDGDDKVFSIGAASIVAKVTRDHLMNDYDLKYPQYGFRSHKGYPTPVHLRALETYGPSPIHRKTFAPVAKYFSAPEISHGLQTF